MIPLQTAELAIAIARGLIKLAGRLDRLLAEKVATQSGLTLKLPLVEFGPGPNRMLAELKAHLAETGESDPGPLGIRRADLVALVKRAAPDPDELREFHALVFPGAAMAIRIDPGEDYMKFLQAALPTSSLEDADARRAAFYAAAFSVDPGADRRQLGYPWRVGLLVVDVLAEFGAENTQLFVRDDGVRAVVAAVLTRFAGPELEAFDQWGPLLRHALRATLNGALDARQGWMGANPWLEAVLSALARAREAAGAGGDDYLLGLLRGRGYHLLISEGLAQVAGVLDAEDAGVFQQIAAEVLAEAAPLVAARPRGFGVFFREHWADLIHAGLKSLDRHGAVLLAGDKPLLREVLRATLHALAETSGAQLLTRETLLHVADAIVSAVATHPELVEAGIDEEWLGEVIQSVARTAGNQGIRKTFTREGLAGILRDAAAVLGERPELLVARPGLFRELVGGVLSQMQHLQALDARTLGSAAVQGALRAVATNPELLQTKFPAAIADFSGLLAAQVAARTLSSLQASMMVSAAAEAALRHPEMYADAGKGVAGSVLRAVLRVAKDDPAGLLSGEVMVSVVNGVLTTLARRGRDKVAALGGDLEPELAAVLDAGLVRANKELGRLLDRSTVAVVLDALVRLWASGRLPDADPESSAFKKVFAELAEGSSA